MRLRVAAILLAIVALAAAPTYAQITGGAKVGVNWANVEEEDDDDDNQWKPGLVVGGFVDVPIAPAFSFAPEFLYSQKGAKNEFTEGGFDIEQKLQIDMFQIPLLFKVGPTDTETRPFFVAGPAVGFVTRARFEESFDGDDLDIDIKDEVKSTEWSFIVGAGVQFGNGIIEVRYDHGLTNLDDVFDEESKTRTFSILLGIGFGG